MITATTLLALLDVQHAQKATIHKLVLLAKNSIICPETHAKNVLKLGAVFAIAMMTVLIVFKDT